MDCVIGDGTWGRNFYHDLTVMGNVKVMGSCDLYVISEGKILYLITLYSGRQLYDTYCTKYILMYIHVHACRKLQRSKFTHRCEIFYYRNHFLDKIMTNYFLFKNN